MAALVVNQPAVVAEIFDTEVVVINLERGTYYSLTGAARHLWPLLDGRLDAAGVAGALAALGADWAAAEAALAGFVQELLAEGLIRVEEGGASSPAAPAGGPAPAYEPARLEKFTDMEELIALDPVHDVSGAQGWPLRTPLGPDTP